MREAYKTMSTAYGYSHDVTAFHYEDTLQILKDEPKSIFCLLNAEVMCVEDLRAFRGFSQEKHSVLTFFNKRRDLEAEEASIAEGREISYCEGKFLILVGHPQEMFLGHKLFVRPGERVRVGSATWAEFSIPEAGSLAPCELTLRLDDSGMSLEFVNQFGEIRLNNETVFQGDVLVNEDVLDIGDVRLVILDGFRGRPITSQAIA